MRKLAWIAPVCGFIVLLLAFLAVAQSLAPGGLPRIHFASAFLSFVLLLLPYWFFGFGMAEPLAQRLNRPAKRIAAAGLLLVPYVLFALPAGMFRWDVACGLAAVIFGFTALLEHGPHHFIALLVLACAVEAPFFRNAFPLPGVSGLAKLLFVDLGLFGFLVVRPIGGVGFVLRVTWRDARIGLREFLFFLPIALTLGFALRFLHFHSAGFPAMQIAASWLFTLFFVALPEEIFFRGLLLNLLERRWGTRWALIVSSLLFGLAHFPKRATFNWRYVILAAIAGVFYGRAWLDRRRVITSGITHATVDAVWSIWLR